MQDSDLDSNGGFGGQDPWTPSTPATPAPQGDPWTPQELAESQQWANQYFTSHQIPAGWGTPDDLANTYLAQRRKGVGHQAAMDATPGLLGWDKYVAPSSTALNDPGSAAPAPAPAAPTGTQTSTPPVDTAGTPKLTDPFADPYVPSGSASPNPTPLPTPAPVPTIGQSIQTIPGAPAFPTIPKFSQPTIEEAMADPGYQFVLDQGNKNLQNWNAARGTLGDSSTAKALIDYGQGAATTQYGNVWNRDYQAYNSDVNTQYIAPFQAAYQNWATGTVNPTLSQFGANTQATSQNNQTAAANQAHLNDVSWQDNWNQWLQKFNIFQDQRDSTFNKQFQVATA